MCDAVNFCDKLAIKFPSTHAEQEEIAAGFQKKNQGLVLTIVLVVLTACWFGQTSQTKKHFSEQNLELRNSSVAEKRSLE